MRVLYRLAADDKSSVAINETKSIKYTADFFPDNNEFMHVGVLTATISDSLCLLAVVNDESKAMQYIREAGVTGVLDLLKDSVACCHIEASSSYDDIECAIKKALATAEVQVQAVHAFGAVLPNDAIE